MKNKMTNMNKLSKHIIIAIITITTIAGCIYAGNVERNDAVLSGMSMEKYQYIHDRIGGRASSSDVVKEAARRHIPTAVHESNAVPGLTTKALSKVVDCVMVGFEESRAHYDNPDKVVVTGTPVRGDFFRYTREEARKQLGIEDNRPLLLSYWGSLGAEVMNRQMVDFIAKECYEGAPFRHIHGAGRDFSWMQEELLRRGLKLGDNGVEVREPNWYEIRV